MGNKPLRIYPIIPGNVEHCDRRIADPDNSIDKDGIDVVERVSLGWGEDDRYGNWVDRDSAAADGGGDRGMYRGINYGDEMDMILVFLFNRW